MLQNGNWSSFVASLWRLWRGKGSRLGVWVELLGSYWIFDKTIKSPLDHYFIYGFIFAWETLPDFCVCARERAQCPPVAPTHKDHGIWEQLVQPNWTYGKRFKPLRETVLLQTQRIRNLGKGHHYVSPKQVYWDDLEHTFLISLIFEHTSAFQPLIP